MLIYLVRHGKPVFEGPRIALGQGNDVPVIPEYLEDCWQWACKRSPLMDG